MKTWPALGGCLLVAAMMGGCLKPVDAPLHSEGPKYFPALYASNCSGCHGADGKNGAAPPLNYALYLMGAGKQNIRDVIAKGRPGTPMPAFATSEGGPLSDAQVDALADGMESKWGHAVDLHGTTLPPFRVEDAASGDAGRGGPVYEKYCAGCHGKESGGKSMAGSVIDPAFLTLASDQGLRTTAIYGRPDFGMPDWRSRLPNLPMSDQEISDVVAWLVSHRPKIEGNSTMTSSAAMPSKENTK